MPALGTFVLHSMANPPLKAGDYTLNGQVSIERSDGSSVGAIDPQVTQLRITSPRYRLPPDQTLSTFPPANAVGAFSGRLPQIVLKRRTLPWEREPAPGASTTPWLALVVIAEGEGTLSPEVPVHDCVTPGITLAGPNDAASGVYLSVTRSVIDKVLPMRDELALLCHVREVDVSDTELAAGDDDGFLATVIANRLPQYDSVNDKPVRYMACLINVEGQLDALAQPAPKTFQFLATEFVFDFRAVQPASGDADHLVMGHAPTVAAFAAAAPARVAPIAARAGGPVVRDADEARPAGGAATAPTKAGNKAAGQQWATTTAKIEKTGLTAAQDEAGRLVRDTMREGYRGRLEQLGLAERVYRFPVLTHWSFTVSGVGGFDFFMQQLDVGLLGTEPPPPKPGETQAPRPAAEFTETGHVGLPHQTRGGEHTRAWYRGPLGPYQTERDVPVAHGTEPPKLPLAHVSDQLRRVVPDGREDLSLAAAFEIGRLLALSQPSLVRALLAWRGEQFGAARAQQILNVMKDAPALALVLKGAGGELASLLSRHLVTRAADKPERVLAPTRPMADPGRPLPYAKEGGLDRLIAEGFGFTTAQVQEFRSGVGSALALHRVEVPLGERPNDQPLVEGVAVERLRGVLSGHVDRLTTDSIGRVGGGVVGGIGVRGKRRKPQPESREPDALDAHLDRLTRSRRRTP